MAVSHFQVQISALASIATIMLLSKSLHKIQGLKM